MGRLGGLGWAGLMVGRTKIAENSRKTQDKRIKHPHRAQPNPELREEKVYTRRDFAPLPRLANKVRRICR
jgi:hypothetical protein